MLRSLIVSAAVFAAAGAQGAAFSPITFSTSADYTSNFTANSHFTYDSTNQLMRFGVASGSSAGTSELSYTPSSNFLTETLSYDTSFSVYGGTLSSGIFTRVQSDHTGVLGLVNVVSGTTTTNQLQLRLFYGADSAGNGVGTQLYNSSTITLPRSVAAGSAMHVTLTETGGANQLFNLTVSDGTGTLATSGNVALAGTGSSAYTGAGGIALRASSSATNGLSMTFDNLAATATPEPAALAMLGLGGLALLRRRRA